MKRVIKTQTASLDYAQIQNNLTLIQMKQIMDHMTMGLITMDHIIMVQVNKNTEDFSFNL